MRQAQGDELRRPAGRADGNEDILPAVDLQVLDVVGESCAITGD